MTLHQLGSVTRPELQAWLKELRKANSLPKLIGSLLYFFDQWQASRTKSEELRLKNVRLRARIKELKQNENKLRQQRKMLAEDLRHEKKYASALEKERDHYQEDGQAWRQIRQKERENMVAIICEVKEICLVQEQKLAIHTLTVPAYNPEGILVYYPN